MDTQNTPIHIRIWSRHFWMLVLANLLLGVSVFMLLPYIPAQMQADGYTLRDVGLVMLAFGLGIVIPGPYVSYFIERFRRNKVCLLSILLLVVFSAILYEADVQKVFHIGFSGTLAVRVLQGFCYGLTEMVVYSTLVLDTCESLYRTEASHVLSWTGRCSLALGPLAAMIISQVFGVSILPLASAGCALLSVILMYVIPFPFRAPNEVVRPWSLDRFFLPKSTPLVVNTILITATFGLLLSLPLSLTFYALMLPGFLLALLAEKAFDGQYDRPTIDRWLTEFLRRFFISQFKRSCIPDSPKVGSVSLSPRGDWRMPSDAAMQAFLQPDEQI